MQVKAGARRRFYGGIDRATTRSLMIALRLLLSMLLLCGTASAATTPADYWPEIQALFPQATSVGTPQDDFAAAPVLDGELLLGFAVLTGDVAPIPAYSGKPVNSLVGFDLAGELRGVEIVEHEEPILVVGISDEDLARFTSQYRGLQITDDIRVGGRSAPGRPTIDSVTGATITVMVINRSIALTARRASQALGIPSGVSSSQTADENLEPLWREVWRQKYWQIGILTAGLVVLVLILLFQDWLAKRPRLLTNLRTGYLLFTLIFIGWFAFAQLSIVNVLTYMHSLLRGFSWESFLIDPMLFILWSFVAVTVVLWGRGVYCGWLCPFGALQELLYRLGQRLGIPHWEPPRVLHERLWALKYIVLIVLFGVSLQSLRNAERLAEIEPFKTVFALHFWRDWQFVIYALAVLAVGLLVRKAFCRYLCPLGAALTFPGRFRIFDWLRRRKECGRPCQICAEECEVGSIAPTGEIIDTECHYCLDCQVTYWNDHKCPPLVEARKKAERRARFSSVTPQTDLDQSKSHKISGH
jgi:hypothetical protein